MKFEISEIKDRGTLDERIIFTINEDCDIGKYFVFTTVRDADGKNITSLVRDAYWFPDKQVKKGDLVVLYSNEGKNSFKVNDDKTSSHFYYRNSKSPLLSNNNLALLVELSAWKLEKILS